MKTVSIDPKEISVVIQGPLHLDQGPGAYDCIGSIKRHLPGAEIIVSTWLSEPALAASDVSVIRSELPPLTIDVDGRPINTQRQRLSTLRGIEAAKRPYVLKFRANHRLTDARIAQVARYEDDGLEQYRLFSSPVTTTTMFFRDPSVLSLLFHPSDLVQFGRREDLLSFWSAPPIEKSELFLPRPRLNPFGSFVRFTGRRYVPEQELVIAFLRSRGYDVALGHICHLTPDLMRFSESILLENFHVLDWQDAGIEFPARMVKRTTRQAADYSAASAAEIKEKLVGRSYALRWAWTLAHKFVFAVLTRKWWRRATSYVYLRWPAYLNRLRQRHFRQYAIDAKQLAENEHDGWQPSWNGSRLAMPENRPTTGKNAERYLEEQITGR